MPLLFHPAGVAFHWDHGIDVTASPTWELASQVDVAVAVLSEDPPRAEVTVTADDERLVAEYDENATIVSTRREAVEAGTDDR